MSVPIPIRGPLAVPFRIFGITRSKMNPNICTICERAFRRVKKHRHISATATILFADIRGFTRLSDRIGAVELSDIVSVFQDQCAQGIWAHDGIVNKQMGDGLMAIFNFPIKIERHAEAAVTAALDIQRRCKAALATMAKQPRWRRGGYARCRRRHPQRSGRDRRIFDRPQRLHRNRRPGQSGCPA